MGNYRKTGYHASTPTGWNRNATDLVGDYVGIELELDNNEDSALILNALPDTDTPSLRPVAEQDGSLSIQGGVEIVFPPLKVGQLLSSRGYFRRAINALNADANVDFDEDCGMHININTNGEDDTVLKLWVALYNHLPADVLAKVGGRGLNGYCQQWYDEDEDCYFDDDYDEECECDDCTYNRERRENTNEVTKVWESSWDSHHSVVGVRNKRLEFRFPAATTNMDNITRAVSFIYYTRGFIRACVRRKYLTIESTLEETFGSPKDILGELVEYIRKQPVSTKRTLVLEVIDARKRRRKAA